MNGLKFIILYIFFALFCVLPSWSQSDFDLSQRWFNEFVYNPASAGNSFTSSAFLHVRNQWAGVSGAPTTQAASFDTYVENINSGLGLSFSADQIGLERSYNVRFAYSYYIPFTKSSALSLGLSAGIFNRSKRASDGTIEDPNEPELSYGNKSETSPDFDFGVEYKGPVKLGLSIRHIGVQPSSNYYPKQSVNVWSYITSRFNLSQKLSIEPVLSYVYHDKNSRFEIGTLFYFLKNRYRDKYNDRFWLGGVYKMNGEFSLLAGASLSSKIRVGYSFDYGTGPISTLSKYGTHEIFISFQFNRIFYKDAPCPAYRNSNLKRKL